MGVIRCIFPDLNVLLVVNVGLTSAPWRQIIPARGTERCRRGAHEGGARHGIYSNFYRTFGLIRKGSQGNLVSRRHLSLRRAWVNDADKHRVNENSRSFSRGLEDNQDGACRHTAQIAGNVYQLGAPREFISRLY